MLRTQPHARWHGLATLLVMGLGWWCELTREEWLAVLLATGMVWVAEALNSAVEQTCDAVTLERRAAIRRAKDVAAGAVLLAAVVAAAVGLLVFVPKFLPP